jgi:hypothetical protein
MATAGPRFLQVVTPPAAAQRSVGTRLALAGGTVLALAVAGSIAVGAFSVLLVAMAAIYFLVTQVLGIRIDVDPEVLMRQAREAAAAHN